MPAIASIAGFNAPAPGSAAAPANDKQTMDFMKLLMTQMRNQNPMEPKEGTEFMSQMAQFSQLEGINKLNQNITDMLTMQNLTQGTSLIGKTVTYDKDGTGATTRGTVGSVAVNAGKVQLMVGGVGVGLPQIRTVETGPKAI